MSEGSDIEIRDTEAQSPLSERDRKSIAILRETQNCGSFRIKQKEVQFYSDFRESQPSAMRVSVKDYLNAIDYYQANRETETGVRMEMQKPDGAVEVYSPYVPGEEEKAHVVARIPNVMIPEMLEFAYLLLRRKSKRRK